MPTVRVVPLAEGKNLRKQRTPGLRVQRMVEFDELARALTEAGSDIEFEPAAVYEDLNEPGQKFVLSLRGAFRRAGVNATVRKMRGRDEVRAWLNDSEPTPFDEPATKRRSRSKRTVATEMPGDLEAEAVEPALVEA